MRQAVVGAIETLNLRDVTILGESIGGVLALTVAAQIPDRVKAVYALNTYDYETRYGDGIRRGGWFSNLIIGSLQVPIFGAIGANPRRPEHPGQDHARWIRKSEEAAG